MPDRARTANFDETVRRFILRYGESALTEANRRAQELESEGDSDGAETWRQVAAAIAAQSASRTGRRLH
ncbi:MAG TPA: hypothetical protein DIW51_10635 [Rhodospirillaceae bacterium]|nr:hypothetical protein [Magnetovibrio sp.]HBT43796.1 hypothetical protein [Rhodospirillaceae bacterium]HCS70410.1 hypothetical protein [Rhodospirillaceae bacterium]|tara:strand:+ start:78 stop:284 length:207 start_codon:yes stop_codon:yes gene_type:complete